MLTRSALVLLTLALCIALGTGAASQRNELGRGELVYSEDFSSDPGYDSFWDPYVFWDGVGGSYFALSLDVSSGVGRYMGYSPEFALITGDFTVLRSPTGTTSPSPPSSSGLTTSSAGSCFSPIRARSMRPLVRRMWVSGTTSS